jgi:hypothetical protein
MDFDEKCFFGIVMSYTLSYKKLESKICPISLLNLAPKLKFAENRSARYTRNSRITPKFQVICWDIYYFSERLRCRLFNELQKILKLALCKKVCEEQSFKRSRDCP